MSNSRVRQPVKTVPLSEKQRPISRYDAKILNTFAYMYNNADALPITTKINVSSYIIPAGPLSRSESALYKEIEDYIKDNSNTWNAGLIWPVTVPEAQAGDETDKGSNSFLKRLGKYELELYYSFKNMLDANVEPVEDVEEEEEI